MALMKSTTGDIADFQAMFRACDQWFGQAMLALYDVIPAKAAGLLMGCPLWGEEYVQRFEKYCLPTLLSPKNFEALRNACRIVLFTGGESYSDFVSRFRYLDEALGHGTLQVRLIPEAVMAEQKTHWMQKFWMLGVAHNICIREAARCGMSFHMFHPDVAYNQEFFPNLNRLSKNYDGILQDCLTADLTATSEFEKYRHGATLDIPERDVCDIGWRHLHMQQKAVLMNERNVTDQLPQTSWLAWQGRDTVYTAFPHMNPSWMSWKLCAQAPSRIPATIDAELPHFVPATSNFHVANATDGLGYIEISGDNKPHYAQNNDRRAFAKNVWSILKFSDRYLPYYRRMCEIPIHPQNTFMEEGTIRGLHKFVMKILVEGKGQAAIDFARSMDLSQNEGEEAGYTAAARDFTEWAIAERVYA